MFLRLCSSVLALFLLDICMCALVFSKNRSFYFQKIKNTFYPPKSTKQRIWFHAASLGEVNLVKKITEKWQINFFITTNTPGGLAQAKVFQPQSYALSLDLAFSIGLWVKRMQAQGLVLIEAELWPNLIEVMAKNYPVCLINGRVSTQKMQSYWNKIIYKRLLPKFTLVTASSLEIYNFYSSITTKPEIHNNGNLKFYENTQKSQYSLRKIFPKNAFLFVAASLQPEELPIILAAFRKINHAQKPAYLIIIPRHLDKKKQFLKQLQGHDFQVLAQLQSKQKINHKIILVPLLGILADWYGVADSIFVGGSLCNRGGQNMIEALNYSKPTATGYNTKNFEFAMKLFLASNSILRINNTQELACFLADCIKKPLVFHLGLIKAKKIIKEQSKSLLKTTTILKRIYQKSNIEL